MADQLFTPARLCERYPGIFNINTLAYWRQRGEGPKWAKLGKRVAYRETDVQAWLDAQFAKTA